MLLRARLKADADDVYIQEFMIDPSLSFLFKCCIHVVYTKSSAFPFYNPHEASKTYNIKAALEQNMHAHLGPCFFFLQGVIFFFKSLNFAEIIISREISAHIYFD